jgi:GNAT superfamily N-acetyltransferase
MRDLMNIVENSAWGNGPAGKWVTEFNKWEKKNIPADLNISFDAAKRGEDRVYIDYLYIPAEIRAKGWGSKIMTAAVQLADKYGVTLTLVPMWQDDEVEQNVNLWDWYANYGFGAGDEGMIRYPEGHEMDEGFLGERAKYPEISDKERHEILRFIYHWMRGDYMSKHRDPTQIKMWKKIAEMFPPKVGATVPLYRLITVPIEYADKPAFNIHPAPGILSSWSSTLVGIDAVAGVAREMVPALKMKDTARIAIRADIPGSDILATPASIKKAFATLAHDYFDRWPDREEKTVRDDGREVWRTVHHPEYPGADDEDEHDFTMDDVGYLLDVTQRRGGHMRQYEYVVITPPKVQAKLVRVYRKGEDILRIGNDDPHN